MVICLERGADSHMAQWIPLPLTFWYRLTRLVPVKGPSNGCVSMPAGFRRHLVGKTLGNVCYFVVT